MLNRAGRGRGSTTKNLALVLTVTTCMAACSLGGDPGEQASAVDAVGMDLTTWQLPLDPYLPDDLLISYARNLLTQECVTPQGVDYPVYPVDTNAKGPATASEAGRRFFNLSIAQNYGYHYAPTERFDRALANEIVSHQFTEAELSIIEPCLRSSMSSIGDGSTLARELARRVTITDDPRVVSAIGAWRTCIESKGILGVENPGAMPGPELAEQFNLAQAADPDAQAPSQAELDVAIADAECRSSSGYEAAEYEVTFELQAELAQQNRRELEKALGENSEASSAAREVVERIG